MWRLGNRSVPDLEGSVPESGSLRGRDTLPFVHHDLPLPLSRSELGRRLCGPKDLQRIEAYQKQGFKKSLVFIIDKTLKCV